MRTFKFIHLTDTHIVPKGHKLCGLDPSDRLARAVSHINECHSDASFVILSGDISYHGMERGYEAVKEVLAKLVIPYHLMIGNHDDRTSFRKVFPATAVDSKGFVQYRLETSVGDFILLDTAVMGEGHGILCGDRLNWLETELARYDNRPVYLFLHHPPFDVGIPSLDAMGLVKGADRLREILLKYGNVRHLFYGHVHRAIWGSWHGIPTSTLPGTNHQVGLDLTEEEEMYGTYEPPGYGVCLVEGSTITIHLCHYMDDGPRFILSDKRSIKAMTPADLILTKHRF
jgi:3',5'-cyclic AMP phosphodiesterase CpdA